jgi:hypothetical protein
MIASIKMRTAGEITRIVNAINGAHNLMVAYKDDHFPNLIHAVGNIPEIVERVVRLRECIDATLGLPQVTNATFTEPQLTRSYKRIDRVCTLYGDVIDELRRLGKDRIATMLVDADEVIVPRLKSLHDRLIRYANEEFEREGLRVEWERGPGGEEVPLPAAAAAAPALVFDEEDDEGVEMAAKGIAGGKRRRKRGSSPRKRRRSPRKRGSSPRKRGSSPRKRRRSPRKRRRSPALGF